MRGFIRLAALWALLGLASAQLQVSQDGTCGVEVMRTCHGSDYGQCCSEHGWCGSTSEHCEVGCQVSYGLCQVGALTNPQPPGPLPSATSDVNPSASVIYVTSTVFETSRVVSTQTSTVLQTLTTVATQTSTTIATQTSTTVCVDLRNPHEQHCLRPLAPSPLHPFSLALPPLHPLTS